MTRLLQDNNSRVRYSAEEYLAGLKASVNDSLLERELIHRAGFTEWHKRVLDIGCGDATHLAFLVARFPSLECAVGLDISYDMLKQSGGESTRLRLAVADMNSIPVEDCQFDFVYSRYAIHYSEDLCRTLGEVARVTRPGGTFYFRDAHPISGLMLKRSLDYERKESATFVLQCDSRLYTRHPCFTFEEYITAIVSNGWHIVDMHEIFGKRASAPEFAPYRIPTTLAFKLVKR